MSKLLLVGSRLLSFFLSLTHAKAARYIHQQWSIKSKDEHRESSMCEPLRRVFFFVQGTPPAVAFCASLDRTRKTTREKSCLVFFSRKYISRFTVQQDWAVSLLVLRSSYWFLCGCSFFFFLFCAVNKQIVNSWVPSLSLQIPRWQLTIAGLTNIMEKKKKRT